IAFQQPFAFHRGSPELEGGGVARTPPRLRLEASDDQVFHEVADSSEEHAAENPRGYACPRRGGTEPAADTARDHPRPELRPSECAAHERRLVRRELPHRQRPSVHVSFLLEWVLGD